MAFDTLVDPNTFYNDFDGIDFLNTYDDLAAFSLNVKNFPCPAGSYCPESSRTPIACPVGTYNPNANGIRVEQCLECTAGFYCPCEG